MLFSSHLLATLVTKNMFSLRGGETIVALIFGTGIDTDHLFVNKKWITDTKDYIKHRKITRGVNQHSYFQEVIFGEFFGILTGFLLSKIFIGIRWWICPLFLGLHIFLDSVMYYEHQPFFPFNKFKYWGWLRSGTRKELFFSVLGLLLLFFTNK